MRSVPEWIAKHDDEKIPDRVKERVAKRTDERCASCRRKIDGKLRAEFDHVTPLSVDGQNRESNLQMLCHECHGAKTKLDVRLKARASKFRKERLGIRKAPTLKSRGFDKAPPQRRASAPVRKWRGTDEVSQ